MQPLKIDCPYGAGDCPKISDLKRDVKSIKKILWAVVVFLAAEFGTTFLAVLS